LTAKNPDVPLSWDVMTTFAIFLHTVLVLSKVSFNLVLDEQRSA